VTGWVETMQEVGTLWVVLPLLAAAVLLLLMYPVRRTGRASERPLWHYLMLWPVIHDMRRVRSSGYIARTLEVMGWVVVTGLVVMAMVFAV
jgi:uncharacterized membrane protein YqhA